MPFCTACGKEIDADQKFCEFCGAEQDPPSVVSPPQVLSPPPPALTPPPVTPSPFPREGKLPATMNPALIVGVVVAVAFIAGMLFLGIPSLKGTTSHGTAADVTPSPEITTAVPTQTVPTTVPQTPVLKRADQYEETYEQVYTRNRSYKFGQKEVVSHDLVRPPLYIRFNITPGMVVREKLVDIGLSSEHNITVMYVNPNAWFEVTVFDSGTGTIIDKRGFNKGYSQITKQEFMVRTKGTYRIVMSGNDVSVNVQILTGD
jgi:hypothetical protein